MTGKCWLASQSQTISDLPNNEMELTYQVQVGDQGSNTHHSLPQYISSPPTYES